MIDVEGTPEIRPLLRNRPKIDRSADSNTLGCIRHEGEPNAGSGSTLGHSSLESRLFATERSNTGTGLSDRCLINQTTKTAPGATLSGG